jgi:hypothetical protein
LVFFLEKDKKMLVKESKKSVDHNLKNEAHMQLGLKMTGGLPLQKIHENIYFHINHTPHKNTQNYTLFIII